MTTEQRLTKLERSLRRWKLGAILGVGLVAGMGALKPIPREVDARNFVVRDDDGKVRAMLGLRDAIRRGNLDVPETPMLLLYGPDGAEKPPAVELAFLPFPVGGTVGVYGPDGKRIGLNQMGVSFMPGGPMWKQGRESEHKVDLEFMPGDK
jgi:hypothetical protein